MKTRVFKIIVRDDGTAAFESPMTMTAGSERLFETKLDGPREQNDPFFNAVRSEVERTITALMSDERREA